LEGLLLATLAGLALPRPAYAETVVAPLDPVAPAAQDGADDVAPPSATDEVRSKSCTAVCLKSGEDPYRCEEDCVFVTETDRAAAQRSDG
jgi:hypothetical protein